MLEKIELFIKMELGDRTQTRLLLLIYPTDAAERISTVSGFQHLSYVDGDLSSEVSSFSLTHDNISVE
jgi:hypothetical protein